MSAGCAAAPTYNWATLRHQLTVLQGKVRGRGQFTHSDRLFFIQLYRWFPSILKATAFITNIAESDFRYTQACSRSGSCA